MMKRLAQKSSLYNIANPYWSISGRDSLFSIMPVLFCKVIGIEYSFQVVSLVLEDSGGIAFYGILYLL